MSGPYEEAAGALRGAIAQASAPLVERETLVELLVLCAVAQEHLLIVGPPGTAKSEAVRRVARAIDARYFEYLLGRFTEPSEIFGPVDLRRLREGVVETETAGMLPEAEIAFLDEVFLGSTAILNTLLAVLNERVFRRGHTNLRCPLRVCVGASNHVPEGETLAAFADRFLVQLYVEPIPDPRLEELLERGWGLQEGEVEPVARLRHLDLLSEAARACKMDGARGLLAQAVRRLRGVGVALSDRRVVKVQKLVAAAAALGGRSEAGPKDLWPLVFAVPSAQGQRQARDVLRQLLEASENAALPSASAEASLGAAARMMRVLKEGEAVLGARPEGDEESLEAWRLKLEGVAREIDAGFAKEVRSEALEGLRRRIVRELQGGG
jgi:MoxR-like ATPase